MVVADAPNECDEVVIEPSVLPNDKPVSVGIVGLEELKEVCVNEDDVAPKGFERLSATIEGLGPESDHIEPSFPPKDNPVGGWYDGTDGSDWKEVTEGDDKVDLGGGEKEFGGENDVL